MNIEVVYKSLTGHSKKLAKAIAAEFSVEAVSLKSKPELKDIDIMFFAGGIYSGKSPDKTINFIKTLNPSMVKKVVLITSSASDKCGQDEIRKILTGNGIEVIGEYRCKGNFLFIKIGHPNKNEIVEAVEFCKKILEDFKKN